MHCGQFPAEPSPRFLRLGRLAVEMHHTHRNTVTLQRDKQPAPPWRHEQTAPVRQGQQQKGRGGGEGGGSGGHFEAKSQMMHVMLECTEPLSPAAPTTPPPIHAYAPHTARRAMCVCCVHAQSTIRRHRQPHHDHLPRQQLHVLQSHCRGQVGIIPDRAGQTKLACTPQCGPQNTPPAACV